MPTTTIDFSQHLDTAKPCKSRTSSAASSSYSGLSVFITLLLYTFHIGFILARTDARHSRGKDLWRPLYASVLQPSAKAPLPASGSTRLGQRWPVFHAGTSRSARQREEGAGGGARRSAPRAALFHSVSPGQGTSDWGGWQLLSSPRSVWTGRAGKLCCSCMRPHRCTHTSHTHTSHTHTHTVDSASRFRIPALVTWKQV